MLCSDSTLHVQDLPACVSSLTVGTIGSLSSSLYAKFQDNTNGRTYIYGASSNGSGLVTLSINEPMPVNHSIALKIYLATDHSLATPLNVTISGETGNEIHFSFIEAFDDAGDNHSAVSATFVV